jgi:hypothetical protein
MEEQPPEEQFAAFLAKFTPEIGALTREALEKMRARLPGAVELVYDNYNALVVGFGPTERASEAILSIAVVPRWINLCFLQAAGDLPDPENLLKGSGKVARHIEIRDAAELDQPAIQALIAHALERAPKPVDDKSAGCMVIKSISAKQRPRRPPAKTG